MTDRERVGQLGGSPDPYHYSRQEWIGGAGIVIGALLGFVAWWFAVAVGIVVMLTAIVGIFVTAKREAKS